MIITINKVQVDLTKDSLDGLTPTFSFRNGRKFSLGNKEISLNQIIRAVRREALTSPSSDLGELITAFKELKEKGYKGKEIDSECFLVRVFTKIKHHYSKKTTEKLIKSLEKCVINAQQSNKSASNSFLVNYKIINKALNSIYDNNVDQIQALLQGNVFDEKMLAECLTCAVRSGSPEMVNVFLPLIKDLNSKDAEEKTILIRSIPKEIISNDHIVENIKILLENGADANIPDNHGCLPIHKIVLQKHLNRLSEDVFRVLIPYTKDINSKDSSGNTILSYAAWRSIKLIKMLIENGADANSVNLKNALPLHLALSIEDQPDINEIRLLIENTSDLNVPLTNGFTSLHIAASLGFVDIVDLLIEKGADPTKTDKKGQTPAQLAQKSIDTINNLDKDGRAGISSYYAELRLPKLQAIIEKLQA